MKFLKCCKKDNTRASARVIDGKLILSFPDAMTPVLWQMDLSDAKASALEVQEDKKEKIFTLMLKTARGEAVKVASFTERSAALGGLMAAANALSSAHGQIRSATAGQDNLPGTPVRQRGIGRWGSVALFILLLFILINIWGAFAPRPSNSTKIAPMSATSGTPSTGEAGVPMSADDFLKNR